MTKKRQTSPRPSRRVVAALVIAATAIAFLERWWFPYAWGEPASLTSVFYYGDATRFVDYALAIASGRLFDNGIPYHPPGWPLLLAAFFRWSGTLATGPVAVPPIKLLAAALSALSVGVATLMAGEMAGIGALVVVGLLGPFDFGHIVEGTVANSEALYGLAVVVAAWASWRWIRSGTRLALAWAALTAAFAAGATIVRAEFLVAALLIAAIAWLKRPTLESVVYAATFCLLLVPTTLWHWRTLSAFNAAHVGRVAGPLPVFAPVTSYGPFNFAMANHEDADGGPNRDHPMLDECHGDSNARLEVGQLDLACAAIYDLYVHGYTIGASWTLRHPGDALSLLARKVVFTVGFLGHGFLADDFGVGVDGVRRRVDLVDPARGWLIPIRLALIGVGVVALRRTPVALTVLAAPLAAFVASTLMFYGYVRLGVAYLPIVWILEGAGVATVAFAATGRRATNSVVVAALLVMALAAGYDRSVRDVTRHVTLEGTSLSDGVLIQDETVKIQR